MPGRARFQPIAVVHRGYPIAHVRDTRAGRDHWVYLKNGRLRHWDRLDQPVENELLRRAARTMLRREAKGKGPVSSRPGEQMSLGGKGHPLR